MRLESRGRRQAGVPAESTSEVGRGGQYGDHGLRNIGYRAGNRFVRAPSNSEAHDALVSRRLAPTADTHVRDSGIALGLNETNTHRGSRSRALARAGTWSEKSAMKRASSEASRLARATEWAKRRKPFMPARYEPGPIIGSSLGCTLTGGFRPQWRKGCRRGLDQAMIKGRSLVDLWRKSASS